MSNEKEPRDVLRDGPQKDVPRDLYPIPTAKPHASVIVPLMTEAEADAEEARINAKATELSKLRVKLLTMANDCEYARQTTNNEVVANVLKEAQKTLLAAYAELVRR